MICTSCNWFNVNQFRFPDGTKTMYCEKYNKHLGFTNKKGKVIKVKHLIECKGEVKNVQTSKGKENDLIEREGVFYNPKTLKYSVEVNDNGRYCVIARVDTLAEGKEILRLFNSKQSFIPNIYWETKRARWVCRIYDRSLKRSRYIVQTKYFSEAIEKLKKAKGEV